MEVKTSNTMKDRIHFLWELFKPSKFIVLSCEICLIATNTFEIIKPLILAAIVDESFIHGNKEFFYKAILIYLVFVIGKSLIRIFYSFGLQRFDNTFTLGIKIKMYEKLLYAKANRLSNLNIGDVQFRINSEADEMINIIQRNFLHSLNQIISYIITISIVFTINKYIALYLLCIIPLCAYITKVFGKKIKKIEVETATVNGQVRSKIYEFLGAMRDIQILNAITTVKRKIVSDIIKLIRLNVKSSEVYFKVNQGNSLINLIATMGLFFLSAVMVYRGNLTVGLFIAVYQYYNTTQGHLDWMATNYVEWQKRKVSLDRIKEIIDIETEPSEEGKETLNIKQGNIEFKNVSFWYEDNNPVLQNISFSVLKGEKVALVGTSGVGKSTIASLILKFYSPCKGQILIDNQDIDKCTYKSCRKGISIIQQEFQLFSGSIRYNLLLGNKKATESELWAALEKSKIAEYIRELPDGIDTVVGKNGYGLSGGQIQRIMIARAILKVPKILIMDEATSGLDYKTENDICELFNGFRNDFTTITIAHRLSTIMGCDKIILLSNTKIEAQGTHEQLLKDCDVYKELFHVQFRSNEEAAYAEKTL